MQNIKDIIYFLEKEKDNALSNSFKMFKKYEQPKSKIKLADFENYLLLNYGLLNNNDFAVDAGQILTLNFLLEKFRKEETK